MVSSTAELFAHENHGWPPSLSEQGKLRLPTKKSDLLHVFQTADISESYACDVKVIDGAVVVHSLPINDASTFDEYAEKIFIKWVEKQLQNCKRVDIVWDVYKPDSIKESTREKCGKGIRRKVAGQTSCQKISRTF